MKAHYIYFAIGALAILACSRNNEIPEPDGMQMTIRACQEGSNMTRTTLQNGGTVVYWDPSDEIKVFFRGSTGRFVSVNTEPVEVTEFSGTINVLAGSGETSNSSNQIWGLYPYCADATFDGSSVTTTLPAEQTGRAGSFAKNTNISLAHSGGLDLAFYNVCGGLRFSLAQEGIKKVTFEGSNGESLAGKIMIAFAGGVPVIQEVSDGQSLITLTAPGGGTFQTGKWYYISAIPGTLSNGYKMMFYKEKESTKLTSSIAVNIKRGIFGSLEDVDKGLIFSEYSGGETPDPSAFIQFADPVAKCACVEKYDTNKDGELSFAEAAAVKSLNQLFSDWNTVTCFDEIKYFTGVSSTDGVFTGLKKLKYVTIPDHIKTLGSFSYCTSLEKVVLPATLSSIPIYCFSGCTALTSVDLPSNLTTIPDNCFRGCTALTKLTLPHTVTSIGNYAFQGCTSLSDFALPSGCRTIGAYAFQKCASLTTLVFPASLISLGTYAFSGCTALTAAHLASGVSIGTYAFSDCTELRSVTLPDDLTSVSAYCFQNCCKLGSIIWPSSLTAIENNAFEGCRFADNNYALQLPSSVKTIGNNAFGYLHHLVLPTVSFITISSNSFKNGCTFLYVPDVMVEIYKTRTNWKTYAQRIRPIEDYPLQPTVGGAVGEAVDLGLSVRWASWNVGASAPEEYGAYFAWGETLPSLWGYSWNTYKWCLGSEKALSKYNTDSSYGVVDNVTELLPEDDAARANWSGKWRIPTYAEWEELRSDCKWNWTNQDGVYGFLVTGTKEGYTDKNIFLPAAGYINESSIYDVNIGNYWASSINPSYPGCSWFLRFYFSYQGHGDKGSSRCNGLSVRPVCE